MEGGSVCPFTVAQIEERKDTPGISTRTKGKGIFTEVSPKDEIHEALLTSFLLFPFLLALCS